MEDETKFKEITLVYQGSPKIYKVSKQAIAKVLGCEKEKIKSSFFFYGSKTEIEKLLEGKQTLSFIREILLNLQLHRENEKKRFLIKYSLSKEQWKKLKYIKRYRK